MFNTVRRIHVFKAVRKDVDGRDVTGRGT